MKKKTIYRLTALLLALCLVGLCGCGEKGESPSGNNPAPKADYSLVSGNTLNLTTSLTGDVQWSSSQPEYASVDAQGVVKALKDRGNVTITADNGEKTESFTVDLCCETEFGSVSLPSAQEKLTIGAWNGSYHEIDDFRMEMLADAGITLLVGIDERWLVDTDMEGLLDLAQDYGISLITDLRQWDEETVPAYAEHPALTGFLMYDEPCSTKFEELSQLKEKFDQVMPEDLLFYVNLFPEACGYESLYGDPYNPLKVDYEEHYSNLFVDTVGPEILSVDSYALQEGGYIRLSYVHGLEVLAQRAKKEGIPFWYTLCTAGHSTTDGRYGTPTQEELRWQMYMGMTYGAEYLLHYVLTSHETDDYECMLEYETWEPTALYDDVLAVDTEFLAWQDIYMSYDWVGTAKVDVGQKSPLLQQLEYYLPLSDAGALTDVESSGDVLVGVFENNGSNAYMITNAGDSSECNLWLRLNFTCDDAQVKLQLKEGSYRCAAVIENGRITYVPVSQDNTVTLTVEAMNGVFVIPITN